jgi:hypothetical protein
MGIGIRGALLDEAIGQAHKFALGSGHEVPSALLEIMIIALWILIEFLSRIPMRI